MAYVPHPTKKTSREVLPQLQLAALSIGQFGRFTLPMGEDSSDSQAGYFFKVTTATSEELDGATPLSPPLMSHSYRSQSLHPDDALLPPRAPKYELCKGVFRMYPGIYLNIFFVFRAKAFLWVHPSQLEKRWKRVKMLTRCG